MGNANERAWETQKKALYTRFSQALPLLPSLNGYGELYEKEKQGGGTEIVDTAAESFIRDGLSKVMKITNICDSEHLSDCGLPDKIIPINNGNPINLSSINTLSGLNSYIIIAVANEGQANEFHYEMLDTKAAAFETVNGESVLVYYNPNCEPDLGELSYGVNVLTDTTRGHFVQPKMCANFVYDLNGKKGPNTVGKDIGAITALYSTDPVVVAPNPYPTNSLFSITQDGIEAKCKELGSDAKVPTIDELASMFFNLKLFGMAPESSYWSSTTLSSLNQKWLQGFYSGARWSSSTDSRSLRCVKR